jgi:hypothetical protein
MAANINERYTTKATRRIPEHDFNYDDFVKQEFGSQAKPAGLKTIWWIVGIALIVAFVLYFSVAR